ncbi:uncharacterized protein TNCV_4329091 [Trichonephila clavipes]|nr:uncharacterized protein TNCV_4329091 [Trichonephila clavipes]
MNLSTPSQRFNKKESGLYTAVETVAMVSLQIATKEAKDVSGHSDIPVAIDVLSRFCKCSNKMHNENCKANNFGNSGSMEVSGAIDIFQRSESLHGLRYAKFLGDGDSRVYKAVNEKQPYGDTGKKLSDKKTLNDHFRLVDAEIDKLQRYYGLAVKNNTDSINSMKRANRATYFHKASIDAYPQHGLCPTNEETW